MEKRLGEIRACSGLRLFDGVQQPEELPLARGRRHVVGDVFIEDDQARRIPLEIGEVTQRRRHVAREI